MSPIYELHQAASPEQGHDLRQATRLTYYEINLHLYYLVTVYYFKQEVDILSQSKSFAMTIGQLSKYKVDFLLTLIPCCSPSNLDNVY